MLELNLKYKKFLISWIIIFALFLITLLYLTNRNEATQLTFLYFIPILIAAVYLGNWGAVFTSFCASLLFAISTYLNSKGYPNTTILIYDLILQFGAFTTVALIISYSILTLQERQRDIKQRLSEFNLIQEINKVLPSTTNLNKMLEEILTVFIKNMQSAQKGVIGLVDEENNEVRIASTYGIDRNRTLDLKIRFDENHLGQVIQKKQPILINDFYRKSHQDKSNDVYQSLVLEYGVKSILAHPITFLNQPLGVIALYNSKNIEAFTERDVQLLEIVSEEIAIAINNAQLHQNTKRDLLEHQLLYRIGLLLTSSEDINQILNTILDSALKITNTPAGSIALYDQKKQEFFLKASKGFSAEFTSVKRWKLRPGGLTSQIINKRIPLNIPDVSKEPSFDNPVMIKEGIKSILTTPLLSDDKIIGIIYIDDFVTRDFTKEEISIMSLLANQATIAIDKAQMIKETKKLAITDGLTSCFNHRFFIDRLEEEIKRAERYERPTSLIMIDLDFFKIYNDAYGHPQGDEALKKIAEILQKTTRSTDLVARYGGDEYAKTTEGLIASADDALYQAKKNSNIKVQVAKVIRSIK